MYMLVISNPTLQVVLPQLGVPDVVDGSAGLRMDGTSASRPGLHSPTSGPRGPRLHPQRTTSGPGPRPQRTTSGPGPRPQRTLTEFL